MVVLSLMSIAAAAPISDGLQAQIHPAGFEFLSSQLSGTGFDVGPTNFETVVECYDPLTVDEFNLEVGIETIEIVPNVDTLDVVVTLGTVRGTYWELAGYTGWLDLCFDFEAIIELVELRDGLLVGSLAAEVIDGALQLEFVDTPVVSGAFESDIDWFPDDLVWDFASGLVLDQVAGLLEDQVPALVADLTSESLLIGSLGDVPLLFDVSEVEVSTDGLYASVDVDLAGPRSAGAFLELDPLEQSHMALGLTEPLAQDLLNFTWQLGLLDPDSATTGSLINDLIGGLDLGADVAASLGVGAAPRVDFDPEGLLLSLDALELDVKSGGETLLHLVTDLVATLDVTVATSGSLALTAHDIELAITTLDADGLVQDVEGEANLQAFLEGWVVRAASTSLSEIPIYSANFEVLGYVLHIDDVLATDGGLGIWVTLYASDDPAIDSDAPDTSVTVLTADATVDAMFSAIDDRPGELQYSWALDGGAWSSWTSETTETIAVTPGPHTLEVQSRDTWQNIDLTPASATFELLPAEPLPEQGCGCENTSGVAGLFATLARRR